MERLEHRVEGSFELKYCGKCKSWKSINNFFKNSVNWDGLTVKCKVCCKEYQSKYYQENKDTSNLRCKIYREKNKEYINFVAKKYRKEHPEVNRRGSKKRRENVTNRLSHNVGSLIWHYLRKRKNGMHWEVLVGYTLAVLIAHLESLWESWMNWSNYGIGPGMWQIDHIKPIIAFHFTSYDDREFKECWALPNLRPLSWEDNYKKTSIYNGIRLRKANVVKL